MRALAFMAAAALLASSVSADWNPGDPHKMHFPQLPDASGWDVGAELPILLADDWLCTETGPVLDIHFWGSWLDDWGSNAFIEKFHVIIYSGGPVPPTTPLWVREFHRDQFTIRGPYYGEQGWYNPMPSGYYAHPDHYQFFQYNITSIPDPFVQVSGNVYWLAISAQLAPDPNVAANGWAWGWKTSHNHWNRPAVWAVLATPDELAWQELYDPRPGNNGPLDLAFVITPEPAAFMILGPVSLLIRRR